MLKMVKEAHYRRVIFFLCRFVYIFFFLFVGWNGQIVYNVWSVRLCIVFITKGSNIEHRDMFRLHGIVMKFLRRGSSEFDANTNGL